eukprot:1185653-Pyramimonas_sp.AAC.2
MKRAEGASHVLTASPCRAQICTPQDPSSQAAAHIMVYNVPSLLTDISARPPCSAITSNSAAQN